jgi:CBS domain-containing protein
MKISDVVSGKARPEVITIAPDAGVRDLLALLAEHNIGAVVVSGDGRSVDGIVSERDVVRRLHHNEGVLDTTVASVMTTSVLSVSPEDTLDATRRLMTDRRFRHVPVVDGDVLVGIVSIGDVVKAHIDQVEFEKEQLESYVHQG